MKSRYTDSYEEYINTPSSSENIAKFKRTIKSDYKTWSDFEIGMAKYAQTFTNESDFLECFRDYSLFLNDYLKREEERYFEKHENNPQKLYFAIVEQMKKSIYRFYEGTTNDLENKITQEIQKSKSINIFYINFNYTEIFDDMLRSTNAHFRIKNKCEGLHIHGTLSHDMVLGVDNELQIEKIPFDLSYKGKCAFLKTFFNSQFDSLRVTKSIEYIQKSDYICIFGMQLGDSDLTWKKEIVNWLHNSPKHILFYYDFEAMMQKDMLAFDRMCLSLDKKDVLKRRLGVNDIPDNQIQIPVGNEIFNLGYVSCTFTEGIITANPPPFHY